MTIAVQVMGKLRGTIAVPPDAPAATAIAAAEAEPNVARALEGKRIVKEITCRTGSSTSWSPDDAAPAAAPMLALAAGAALSGCGFQPVYMPTASGKAGVAQRELAAIQVAISSRIGPASCCVRRCRTGWRWAQAASHDATSCRSRSGSPAKASRLQQNTTVTRLRLIGNATWTSGRAGSGTHQVDQRLRQGGRRAQHLRRSSISPPTWRTKRCSKRLAEALADQITLQLAIVLPQARDGTAEPHEAAAAARCGVPARSRRLPRGAAVWRRRRDDPGPRRRFGAGGGRVAGRSVPGRGAGAGGRRAVWPTRRRPWH